MLLAREHVRLYLGQSPTDGGNPETGGGCHKTFIVFPLNVGNTQEILSQQ